MTQRAWIKSIDNWSPEQLHVVHDFCQLMSEAIWDNHSEQLIEYLNDESDSDKSASSNQQNLELPFSDTLPF